MSLCVHIIQSQVTIMLMANYRGHIGGGIVAGLAVCAGSYLFTLGDLPDGGALMQDWQLLAGVMLLSVLFGLWPDIDTNSKAQDLFFGIAFVFDVALVITEQYAAAAFLGLVSMTPIVGSHRGWTHKKLTAFLIPAPILIIPYLANDYVGQTAILLYAGSLAGYLSHLLLDGLFIKRFRTKGSW